MDVEVKQIAEIVEAREKQIEEMARTMCDDCRPYSHGCKQNLCDSVVSSAETLYCAGYRKQGEGEWKVTVLIDTPTMYRTGAPHCSACGKQAHHRTPFCPYCGFKMKGGEPDA